LYYKSRNCDGGDPPSPFICNKNVRFVIDKNTVLHFCPKILTFNYDIVEIINLFSLYEKGIMYENGGYLDQPLWYIQAMQLLESEKNSYEKELLADGG
jgi:hypothetical protein